MRSFLLIAFVIISFYACKSTKSLDHDIQVKSNFEFNNEDVFIEIQELSLQSDSVNMTVQFKGGCKNDHRFECVYDPEVNQKSDTLKLNLVHFSEDLCFSILKQDLRFYLNPSITKRDPQYLRVNRYTITIQ